MNRMKRLPAASIMTLTLLAYILVVAGSALAQEISAANTSRYVGNGRWEWTIFIKASSELLDGIKHVEYKLHPTFPNPIRRVDSQGDRSFPFGLMCKGWGTFEVGIEVVLKNGRTRHLTHTLVFESPPVAQPLPITVDNTAESIRNGRCRWTVFIEGPDEALAKIQCVEYTLHPSYSEPVRELCERGETACAFALSEVSRRAFEMKIRVFLKDGSVQKLTHYLKF
jgi:transcription initiation factor IIF auxiliary subunit